MSLNYPENFFDNFSIDIFKAAVEALDYMYDLDIDVHRAVESMKDASVEEMRSLLEKPEVLVNSYSMESMLADMSPIGTPTAPVRIIPTSLEGRFHEVMGDVIHCNRFIGFGDRLESMTRGYFSTTPVLVSALTEKIECFLCTDENYTTSFEKSFDKLIADCLALCARYDDNDEVKPLMAIIIVKEVIDRCIRETQCDLDKSIRKVNPGFNFKTFTEFIYSIIDSNREKYEGYYRNSLKFANGIQSDREYTKVYDRCNGLTCDTATEAMRGGNTRGGSKVMKDLKDEGYAAYKIYKRHEENYDNQATKLAGWAKKIAFGDKREEIIEGKKWTVMGVAKKMLGTVALFSINPVVGVLGTVTKYAVDKRLTYKERMQILKELENEQTMIKEKIEDARSAGDNKAKYALMRVDNELSQAISKIRTAAQTTKNMQNSVRTVLSRGSGT